jgi:hypothetical protein
MYTYIRACIQVLEDCLRTNSGNADAEKELQAVKSCQGDWEKAHEYLNQNDFDRASYFLDRISLLCPDSSDLLRCVCVMCTQS